MSENNFQNVVGSLMKGMESFLSTKTVVGEPTKIGDTIIVPLVDVSFGVGAGATSKDPRNSGGGGMSGKMSPNAVLVIHNGNTKLVNIKNPDSISKIVDLVPEIMDKIKAMKDTPDVTKEEAVDTAFPGQDLKF